MLQRFKRLARHDGWIGVSFTEKNIAYVHVEHNPLTRPKVKQSELVLLAGTDQEALVNLQATIKAGNFPCTHLMSGQDYKMLLVDTPEVPAKELKQAVRWQIKDMLEFPAEQATIDVLEIPSLSNEKNFSSIYVVAAHNTIVKHRMEIFQQAKFRLKVIDIPEMAQRNLAAFLEKPGCALALLKFSADQDSCLLTFTAHGELYLSRWIGVSLKQIQDANESVQIQYLERLVLELQRSFDFFSQKFHALPLTELVLAPFANVDGLQQYLSENLDLNVSTMNLSDVLDLSTVPEMLTDFDRQSEFFLLCGAALRDAPLGSA